MKDSTQRPSPSSPNLQADNPKGAGEGLDVTACSASSFVGVNGVPIGSFGTTSKNYFSVNFMGGDDDWFNIGLFNKDREITSSLTSNYQGFLELRNFLNIAYNSLHAPVSPAEGWCPHAHSLETQLSCFEDAR